MIIKKIFYLLVFLGFEFEPLSAISLAQQFEQTGYLEICNRKHRAADFDSLYASFDACIEFLQVNPLWEKKLHVAKERFIRSKDRSFYSTDFFGLYDESKIEGRNQIAFYYSTHFHAFICLRYPEFNKIPEIVHFLDACRVIQEPYGRVFEEAAADLGIEKIFSFKCDHPPILFKVIKYFPSHVATRPHYDGTAFSIFLDSTDNNSLLLSRYKSPCTVNDFSPAIRKFSRNENENSLLIIPGTLLTEFSIFPTPHIVTQVASIRYAAIAFAMRPNYLPQKIELFSLPSFID